MASNNGTPVPSKFTIGRSNRLSQTPNLTSNNTTSIHSHQTTNAPSCVECGVKCPNCSFPRAPAVKHNEKKNAQLPEPDLVSNDDRVSPGMVDLPRPDNPNARPVVDQTEIEGDKDCSNLHMKEEDKKGENEDKDDAKVEWSKYVSKRLYMMARTDPSSMTAAEFEQFNEQGLKHQYDKHFNPHERTLWDDESLPRDLTLKLIHFRQRIERNAADALETEDKDLHCDTQDFDRLRSFLADLHIDAYELVAEDHEREVKEMEKMQEAVERESVEEEYESAEEEYEHPGEDDFRPPYSDRS